MKSTKILIAVIIVWILTWMIIGAVVYLLSENLSYRESMTLEGVMIVSFFFGWIPSSIVGSDLDKILVE